MSGPSTSDPNEPSDGIRGKPDNVRSRVKSRKDEYLGRYIDQWKDVCRDILRVYARVAPGATYARPLGATLLLRRIAAHAKKQLTEVTLSVDNLYDWLKGETGHIDDVKFSYVDDFIRGLQLEEQEYNPIRQRLHEQKDIVNRAGFVGGSNS